MVGGCLQNELPTIPSGAETGADVRPNIMLIVADDLGFTDIGAFGSEVSTPNIDALAYAGIRLTNLHAGPACQQTRVMLMASSGVAAALELRPPLPSGQRANRLSLDWASLPELLRDAGYATYMAGKWDLGLTEGYTPATRGFDRSFAMLEASASHFAEYFWGDSVPYEEDGLALDLDDLPADFYSTRAYTDKMLEYLQSSDGSRPWFAYLPYTAPHWPLQVPDDWSNRYDGRYAAGYDAIRDERMRRAMERGVLPPGADPSAFVPVAAPWSTLSDTQKQRYARSQELSAAMIEYLDESIGRIVDYLDQTGELDNTVIMFMSDHGASATEIGVDPDNRNFAILAERDNSIENFGRLNSFVDHGRGFGEAASAPFRYFKSTLYEGGLRAAAFVRYPRAIESGNVSHSFMTVMDILPTFLEIAGTDHPGETQYKGRAIRGIRGRSAWAHLIGNAPDVHAPTETAGWSQGGGGALIKGEHKLINRPPVGQSGTIPWRLYDLGTDPGETRDLASQRPNLTADLISEWEADWR